MSKEIELLIYLITSAQALPNEPEMYGSIRLTQAAYTLVEILSEKDPLNEHYQKLLQRMQNDKSKALSDSDAFFNMLSECCEILVESV